MTIDEEIKASKLRTAQLAELEGLVSRWNRFENSTGKYVSIDIESSGFAGRVTGSMSETIKAILAADYKRRATELAKELGVEL